MSEPAAQPAWIGAPQDWLPGSLPLSLLLGRSSDSVVVLTSLAAFPSGLVMRLGVRWRGQVRGFGQLNDELFDSWNAETDAGAAREAGRLRWGFVLSDGSRVGNTDLSPDVDAEPSGARADRGRWEWQLAQRRARLLAAAPAGVVPVQATCAWPARRIAPTAQEVDGSLVRDAAARAVPLWDAYGR